MKINTLDEISEVGIELANLLHDRCVPDGKTEVEIFGKNIDFDILFKELRSANYRIDSMVEDEIDSNSDYIFRSNAFDEIFGTWSREDVLREYGISENHIDLSEDERDWLIDLVDKSTMVGKWGMPERIYDKLK